MKYLLITLLIFNLKILHSQECSYTKMDSNSLKEQPWFGNNQFLTDYRENQLIMHPLTNENLPVNVDGGFGSAFLKIPLKIWVYYSGNDMLISRSEIEESVRKLNSKFNGVLNQYVSAVDTRIQFYIKCDIEYREDSEMSNGPSSSVERNRNNNNFDAGSINVHIIRDFEKEGVLTNAGNASAPDALNNFQKPFVVNMDVDFLNSATFAHEIGHALGLPHTHDGVGSNSFNDDEGNCSQEVVGRHRVQSVLCGNFSGDKKCEVNGDCLCDTEADPGLSKNGVSRVKIEIENGQIKGASYVGGSTDIDGIEWQPDVYNIMSYAPSDFRERFSLSQISVMQYYAFSDYAPNFRIEEQPFLNYDNRTVDALEPDNYISLLNPTISFEKKQLRGFHKVPNGRRGEEEFVSCDVDWVRFDVPHDGYKVNISTSLVEGEGSVNTIIYLYKSNESNLIAVNDDIEPSNGFSGLFEQELTAGTYWIKVVEKFGASGKYYLSLKRCEEVCCFNDLMRQPVEVNTSTGDFNLGARAKEAKEFFGNSITVFRSNFNIQNDDDLGFNQFGKSLNNSTYNLNICNNAELVFLESNFNVSTSLRNKRSNIRFLAGTSLKLANNSKFFIGANSTVTFEEGSALILENNTELTVLSGSVLEIKGILDWQTTNSPLIIKGGGTVKISNNNIFNLLASNRLIIRDNSLLILGENSTLRYNLGALITLNGSQSVLELQGDLVIGDNAVFTYTTDAGQEPGYLRFNFVDNKKELLLSSASASIKLPEIGSDKTALQIANNFSFGKSMFDGSNAKIEIKSGKRFSLFSRVINLDNVNVVGGGRTSVFAVTPSTINSPQAPLFTINDAIFDNVTLLKFEGGSSAGLLRIERAQFKNGALAQTLGGRGMAINRSNFSEGAGFSGFSSTSISLTNNNFVSLAKQTSAISLSQQLFPATLTNNTIVGYKFGVSSDESVLTMACNEIYTNDFGLASNTLSRVLMNASFGSNNLSNNNFSNIQHNYGYPVELIGGANSLFNNVQPSSLPNGPKGRIIAGIVYGRACYNTNLIPNQSYSGLGNQWSTSNLTARPQDNPVRSRISIINFDNFTCRSCPSSGVVDVAPIAYMECPEIRTKDITDQAQGLLRCLTCPIITTNDFLGVPLTDAINRAISFSSITNGSNDVVAFEMLRQILTFPYLVKNKETYAELSKAYIYAKASAAKLLNEGNYDLVSSVMNEVFTKFQPSKFNGNSKADLYYYALDQADLKISLGNLFEGITMMRSLVPSVEGVILQNLTLKIDLAERQLSLNVGEIGVDEFVNGLVRAGVLDPTGPILGCNNFNGPENIVANDNINPDFAQLLTANGSPMGDGEINIFPNPSNGKITLRLSEVSLDVVKILDLSGRLMKEVKMSPEQTNTEEQLDLTSLAKGIYFVDCYSNGTKVYTEKVVIE